MATSEAFNSAGRQTVVLRIRHTVAASTAIAASLVWSSQIAAAAIPVHSQPAFQAAVAQLRATGGTIVLLPGRYDQTLLVSGGFGGWLKIVGKPGARVQGLLISQTRHVSVGPLKLTPVTGDARLQVQASRNIVLHDLKVTARGTRLSAAVEVPDSTWVTIQQSEFSHCGDFSPDWVNCLKLGERSRHVVVDHSWFHDCRGCDFVHGRVDGYLTVRSSRFERALPCNLAKLDAGLLRSYLGKYASVRCQHQDLIELFAGDDLRFVRNYFGVYKRGGAQLYVTGPSRRTTIADNVFRGTDPRVPRWQARVGILVGGGSGGPIPTYVRIERNKIYTGATRNDGYAASISISRGYGWRIRPAARPVIAHNVIGLLETPSRLCNGARMIDNRILKGRDCPQAGASR